MAPCDTMLSFSIACGVTPMAMVPVSNCVIYILTLLFTLFSYKYDDNVVSRQTAFLHIIFFVGGA